MLLLTGDLVDHGSAAEYALLRDLLDAVDIPTYLIPGNHDDRAELAIAFGDHRYLPHDGEPLAYAIDEFREVIAANAQVQRVIAGHVHHYVSAQLGTVPYNTAPGVSYQVVLDLDPTASPKISNDTGSILLYEFADGDCVAHPVTYAESGSRILDFADIVRDYPAFAARLRSGEGLTKDGFGM